MPALVNNGYSPDMKVIIHTGDLSLHYKSGLRTRSLKAPSAH